MNEKQINRLMKMGAVKVENNGIFKLVWPDGSRAAGWMDSKVISGCFASIPAASYKRLGLN